MDCVVSCAVNLGSVLFLRCYESQRLIQAHWLCDVWQRIYASPGSFPVCFSYGCKTINLKTHTFPCSWFIRGIIRNGHYIVSKFCHFRIVWKISGKIAQAVLYIYIYRLHQMYAMYFRQPIRKENFPTVIVITNQIFSFTLKRWGQNECENWK